jgi:hypothetical protein
MRILNRSPARRLSRHTTRLLGGARRPRPPDYLALACRALQEVIKIDASLREYAAEHCNAVARLLLHEEAQSALRKVYGPDSVHEAPSPPMPTTFGPKDVSQVLRLEGAVARSHRVLQSLKSKLGQKTVKKRYTIYTGP